MKVTYAAAACLMAATAMGAPVVPPKETSPYPMQPRQANSTSGSGVTVQFSGDSTCQGTSALISNGWGVYFADNTLGGNDHPRGLGGGLLDNLRGRCGAITGWNPNLDSAGTGLGTTFSTSDFCTAFDISQAIVAAAGGESITGDQANVPCNFNGDLSVQLEGAAQAIEIVGDAIKEAWSVISLFFESA